MRILKTKYSIEIYEDNSIRFFKIYDFYLLMIPIKIKDKKTIEILKDMITKC